MTHTMIILSTVVLALRGLAVLAETVSIEESDPLILYTDPFEWQGNVADPQASFGIYRFSNIDGNYATITYTFRSFTFNTPRWPRENLRVLIQVDGDPFEVDLQDKSKSPDGNIGPNLGPASKPSGPVFRFDGGFMKTRSIKVLPGPRQPNDNLYVAMIVIDAFNFEVDNSFPSGTTPPSSLSSSPSPSRPAPTSANLGGIITTTIIGPSGTSIITTSAPTSAARSSAMSSLPNSGQSQLQSPMSSPLATHDTLSSTAVNPQSTNPTTLPNATLGLNQESSKLNIGLVAGLTIMGFALLAVLMCLLLRRLRKRKQLDELARTSQLPEAAHPYPHLEKTGGPNIGGTDDRLETVGNSEAFTRKLMGWRPRYSLQSPPISAGMQGLSPGARDHAERGLRNEKTETRTPVEPNPTSSITTSPTSNALSSPRPLSTDYAPPQFQSENAMSSSTTRPLTMDLPPMYSPGDPTRRSLLLLQGQ